MPVLAWTGPEGSRVSRWPQFLNSRHMKVIGLSALRIGRLHPPGNIYVRGLVDPRAIVRSEGLHEWKTMGNRTRDLSICSAVPQPIALPGVLGQMGSTSYSRVLVASDLTGSVRPHCQTSLVASDLTESFVASIQRRTFSGRVNSVGFSGVPRQVGLQSVSGST